MPRGRRLFDERTVSCRLSDGLTEELVRRAKEHGLTLGEYTRKIVEKELKK